MEKQPRHSHPTLSDIELVVISTKELDMMLVEKLGASRQNAYGHSSSFYEKQKEVEYLFSAQDIDAFKYVSAVRNIIVHDVNENKLRDRRKYEQAVQLLKRAIVLAQDTKAALPKPPEVPLNRDKGACFIATAVYGDYDQENVRILREFRDKRLLTTFSGRLFVKTYYFCSPPIANFLRKHQRLAIPVRKALDNLVERINL